MGLLERNGNHAVVSVTENAGEGKTTEDKNALTMLRASAHSDGPQARLGSLHRRREWPAGATF
jgi:hypothetical protein